MEEAAAKAAKAATRRVENCIFAVWLVVLLRSAGVVENGSAVDDLNQNHEVEGDIKGYLCLWISRMKSL